MVFKNVQDLINDVELGDTVEIVFRNHSNDEERVSGEVTAYDDRLPDLTIETSSNTVHSIEESNKVFMYDTDAYEKGDFVKAEIK